MSKYHSSVAVPVQCRTCIFREDGNQVVLRPDRLADIQAYLVRGVTHTCHTDKVRACRGGREFQLTIWYRMGLIAEPTDAALASAMQSEGLEGPK